MSSLFSKRDLHAQRKYPFIKLLTVLGIPDVRFLLINFDIPYDGVLQLIRLLFIWNVVSAILGLLVSISHSSMHQYGPLINTGLITEVP